MKVIVLSPEKADPREPVVLAELLDAGMPRYHVRKPSWSALELEQWILFLPEWCRKHLVLHSHHDLAEKLDLGGVHFRDGVAALPHGRADRGVPASPRPATIRSRSSHDLESLADSLGRYDSVFFGPVFRSISKSGYGPGKFDLPALGQVLAQRRHNTEIIALGGITAENAAECRDLGFDGVALLGAIWQSADPAREYLRIEKAVGRSGRRTVGPSDRPTEMPSIMCLTQDGLALGHAEQARQLCAAGARWIQLRMKSAEPAEWLATALEVVGICRRAGALCVINDSVEIALASGADGVHLGKEDGDWSGARKKLGPRRIIGGTVNDVADAQRAREAGCLDYVGVGPLRFTTTKARLAPVLGADGIHQILAELRDLPAWVIGGVSPADVAVVRNLGAAGVAVSSSLYRDGQLAANYREFSEIVGRPLTDCRHNIDGAAQAPALHSAIQSK